MEELHCNRIELRRGRPEKNQNLGMELKGGFFLAIFALLLCGASVCGTASLKSNTNSPCNGTIAECLDEDDEFSMDSEVSRRLLAGTQVEAISNGAHDAGSAFCSKSDPDDPKYASCISQLTEGTKNRCNPYNRCRFHTPNF